MMQEDKCREEVERLLVSFVKEGNLGPLIYEGVSIDMFYAKKLSKWLSEYVIEKERESWNRAVEECAKIALSFTVCKFDNRLAPIQDDEMKIAYKIAKEIRNKLTKGE